MPGVCLLFFFFSPSLCFLIDIVINDLMALIISSVLLTFSLVAEAIISYGITSLMFEGDICLWLTLCISLVGWHDCADRWQSHSWSWWSWCSRDRHSNWKTWHVCCSCWHQPTKSMCSSSLFIFATMSHIFFMPRPQTWMIKMVQIPCSFLTVVGHWLEFYFKLDYLCFAKKSFERQNIVLWNMIQHLIKYLVL